MIRQIAFLLAGAAMFFCSQPTIAQHARTMTLSPGSDGIFRMKEVETIFTSENDTVRVLIVMPAGRRSDAYAEVDLQDDDKVLMVNGKRVKTVTELETLYGKLAVGEKLKMGILRSGKLIMASLAKADPDSFPKDGPQMQIVTSGGDTRPWMGTGLMLGEDDGLVYVDRVLYEKEGLQGDEIGDGDELVSLNGSKLENMDQLFSLYEKLDVGAKVDVVFTRDKKQMQFSFKKEEGTGTLIRQ